jgi:signal peptidase I
MNKILKYILITAGILAVIWTVGRLTNMFQWFSAPTISNYPAIKSGDRFFASNLIKPKPFDFICYYSTTPEFGKQIWVHRLCGLENDTLEIREGDLFVNNKFVDDNFPLAHNYILPVSELERVNAFEKVDESFMQSYSTDSIIIYLSDKIITTHSIKAKRQILPKHYSDEYITKQYSAHWNQDNFGPVVVPKGKYFVLGDNRLNSQDSRYIGFIDKSDYVATVTGR